MSPEQIAAWLPVVNTMGVIVILVGLVGAIVRGWLWPKHQVDRTLLEQRKAGETAAKAIGQELTGALEKGIDRIIQEQDKRSARKKIRRSS